MLPFRYEDRRSFATVADISEDNEATLDVRVVSAKLIRTRRRNFTIFEAEVEDAGGRMRAVWYKPPLPRGGVQAGTPGGPVRQMHRRPLRAYGIAEPRLRVPRRRRHAGRAHRPHRACLSQAGRPDLPRPTAVDPPRAGKRLAFDALDPRSGGDRRATRGDGRVSRRCASCTSPPDEVDLAELERGRTTAYQSLAFEEVFLVQLALALRREGVKRLERGISYGINDALRLKLAKMLPFKLTGAQQRVLKEIRDDLGSPHPMNRLLQGGRRLGQDRRGPADVARRDRERLPGCADGPRPKSSPNSTSAA